MTKTNNTGAAAMNEAAMEAALSLAPEIALPRSVVATSYKTKYALRAVEGRKPKAVSKKAAARGCGDWLHFTLAQLTLDPKTNKLDVDRFSAILDANGVDHAHWNRTSKGWQGRFRMTGRLALQRVVAEADGELLVPEADGERIVAAPRSWVAKHQH